MAGGHANARSKVNERFTLGHILHGKRLTSSTLSVAGPTELVEFHTLVRTEVLEKLGPLDEKAHEHSRAY